MWRNAEKVRKQWVAFEGKKTLVVERNGFVIGKKNDWQSVIYGSPDCFPAQIAKNVVDGVAEQLSPTFSDTSLVEHVAMNITVMDVCKSFFAYRCCTCCGFPSVTMEGSLTDWQKLRVTAEALITERCTSEFSTFWNQALLPLLDKFVEEYQKGMRKEAGDERFWNAMCKRDGRSGSGARTWFSGWFNIFFPYISGSQNHYCGPYNVDNTYEPKDSKEDDDGGNEQQRMWQWRSQMVGYKGAGPDVASFPKGLAQAPVTWDYYGKEIDLTFKAGLIGAEQDADGTIRPVSGWFIEESKCEKSTKMQTWDRY